MVYRAEITVVVLCGGQGTRLAGVVPDLPKALAPIGGQPFISKLLMQLDGFKKVILATGFRSAQIEVFLSEYYPSVKISKETLPLGTGGALRLAIDDVQSEYILVINGDTYVDIDSMLLDLDLTTNFCLGVTQVPNTERYGSIDLDLASGIITKMSEKVSGRKGGLISIGVLAMRTQHAIRRFPDTKTFSLEEHFIPNLVNDKVLKAFLYKGKFLDIGIPSDYSYAQSYLP